MFAVISRSDPETHPVPLQRARGEARVSFVTTPRGTMLGQLFQDGAAKIRLPKTFGPDAEAILINSAGGLTGGDQLGFAVDVGANASAVVTTQACEKVYRSLGGPAEMAVRLKVGPGGRLDWLPQETILFDRADLRRRVDVDLAPASRFLAVEAVIFGRRAMGEAVEEGGLHDRWRIRQADRLIHADDIRMSGAITALGQRAAVLAGAGAMATLLYVGDDADRHTDAVRLALGDRGGASAWNGKLVARLVADDGLELRRHLIPAIMALRAGRPLPKAWQL
ncbi:MAG: urease accessory protein UreD [Bauldia sp.]|nr:urease accessory protein UreD [Bauldia sp.]MCW5718248.1 urease accessory protein UreD [Bauldia sp.]